MPPGSRRRAHRGVRVPRLIGQTKQTDADRRLDQFGKAPNRWQTPRSGPAAIRKEWLVHHRGASDQLSTGGIDGLRIHLLLAEKEQQSWGSIDTGIGINQTVRVRVVELADIETRGVAQHVKNKMTAVIEKLRQTVTPVSRLHPRHRRRRLGAVCRYANDSDCSVLA